MKTLVSKNIYYMCLVFVLSFFNMTGVCFAQSEAKAPKAASLFIDEKGEEFIRIPREGQSDELIRLSEASEKDILAAFNNFDFKSIPGQSLKQFGPEYIKFSSALMIVQMSMCFGANSSLADLSLVSSSATPTCVDDFLAHLVDWKGWVGFYFFMLGNRYTSTSLMKVATISLAHVGKTKSIPELRKKLTPFFSYLGMTGGLLASQVVHHFLSAPSWGQCISLLKEEGLGSVPCKEAFTHFLTVEDFWDDFAAGSMSMILGSAAATVTQKVLGSSAHLLKNLPALSARGIKVIGGNSKALDLVARVGSKAIQAIRVGKGMAVATGVPGVMVFVVTEMGQFVLFLAWDEVLRNPVARAYYDWETRGGVQKALLAYKEAAIENKKKKWKAPHVVSTKECRPKSYNPRANRTDLVCTETHVDPLVKSILDLHYGASRFRKKVLLNPIEAQVAGWHGKMNGALQKFKFTKSLISFLTKERDKKTSNAMSLSESAYFTLVLWKASLEEELSRHPIIPKNIKPTVQKLAASLGTTYENTVLIKTEIAPSRTNYFTAEVQDAINQVQIKDEKTVLAILQQLKDYSKNNIETDARLAPFGCNYLPILCLARDTSLALDLQKPFDAAHETNSSELYTSLTSVFGEDLANSISFDFLCSYNKELRLKNINSNGRKADLFVPKILELDRQDYDYNCTDSSALRDKYDFVTTDVLRPWMSKGRLYKNALELLASKNISWTVGNSKKEIDAWWMQSAFKPFSRFLFDMAKTYQQYIQDNLITQIDNVSPQQLVHMSSPQMRGATLDHHIVSLTGSWDRPSISMSLMGQVHFALDTLKYYGPPGVDSAKVDQLKMAFAQYILGVKVEPRLESMEQVWNTYENAVVNADVQSVINAQDDFDRNLKETVLSKEKLAHSLALRKEIVRLKDEIFNKMSYRAYDDLTGIEKASLRIRALSEIEDLNDYVTISENDQKLFATFIMLNETLNNITMEIDKLYDKLGAKPFTGM